MTTQLKSIEICRTPLTGVESCNYQLCVGLRAGSPVQLFWRNKHSMNPKALAVFYHSCLIGFVPQDSVAESCIHHHHGQGYKIQGYVTEYNHMNNTKFLLIIGCRVRMPQLIDTPV